MRGEGRERSSRSEKVDVEWGKEAKKKKEEENKQQERKEKEEKKEMERKIEKTNEREGKRL